MVSAWPAKTNGKASKPMRTPLRLTDFSKMFPESDPLSTWAIQLFVAVNDLLCDQQLLISTAGREGEPKGSGNFYHKACDLLYCLRILTGHLMEAGNLIRKIEASGLTKRLPILRCQCVPSYRCLRIQAEGGASTCSTRSIRASRSGPLGCSASPFSSAPVSSSCVAARIADGVMPALRAKRTPPTSASNS